MGTRVSEVATARASGYARDTPPSQVGELMAAEDVGAMPIVDGHRLLGMVTDRDIVVRAIAKGKIRAACRCRRWPSDDVVAIAPDDDLSEALNLMAQH